MGRKVKHKNAGSVEKVASRTPDNELQERYKVVQDLITQGYTGADVSRWIDENTDWRITRRQAYNYYNDAFSALADESNVNRASYFKLALDRLQWLYMKAVNASDFKLASKITMDLITFLKLDTPSADFDWQKLASDKGWNPAELQERMKRLIAADDNESGNANGHR